MVSHQDRWWDEEAPEPMTTTAGTLTLTLNPYAYVRIDG
jgi:hypothetical protein